ncbi:MAG: hypothetical protein ACREK7_01665, partial [Gemmatimonadota bacterium]
MTEPDEKPITMDETITLEDEVEKEPRVVTGLAFHNKPVDELLDEELERASSSVNIRPDLF